MQSKRPRAPVRQWAKPLTRVSFRVKVLVPILVVILGSGTLLSWMVRRELEAGLSSEFDNRMQATLSEIAARATQGILVEDFLDLKHTVRRVVSAPEILYVFLEDAGRGVLVHTFENRMPDGLAEQTRLPLGKDHAVTPLRSEDGPFLDYAVSLLDGRLGTVHLGVTTQRIREESAKVGRHILVVTALSAAVSGGIVFLIAHVLTRPIRELTRSIKEVGKGDFSIRTDIDTGDEIGDLAGQFNAMTVRLGQWEAKLAEAQKLLLRSERLATIGKIASGVVHEIGNPLHAARQISRALAEHPDRMDAYLPLIQEGLERIHRVIHQLSDYARERRISPREIDLHDVIHGSVRFLEPEARRRNIEMLFSPDSPVHRVHGDPDALGQVFTNVIINSIEAIEGSGTIRLRTFRVPGGHGRPDRVVVSIEDDGPGIPGEIHEEIFDPFFSTKEPGHGTGLGLSICQDIISLHGGSIEVRSEAGSGATFLIHLPGLPGNPTREANLA